MLGAVFALSAAALQLDWRAPAQCPASGSVVASVERWLQGPADGELSVLADVTRNDDGSFVLVLDIAERGKRKLEGNSCTELAEAGALVLALLLDPELLTRAPPVTRAPPLPKKEAASPDPADTQRLKIDLGVRAIFEWGALRRPGPGWHATFGLTYDALRFEVFGGMFGSQLEQSRMNVDHRAVISLDFDVGVRPCWEILHGRVRPTVCGTVLVGRTRAQGFGDANLTYAETKAYGAVLAGAGLAVDLFGRLALVAQVEAGVPVVQSSYAFPGEEPLFTSPLFALRGELGLQVRVW